MKICPKCNYQFNDTESFCSKCGANLIQAQNPISKKKRTNFKASVILCIAISIFVLGLTVYKGIESGTKDYFYEPPVYGYIDADKIKIEIPEIKVIYSEMQNRNDGVYVTIYLENISQKNTIDNYRISVIYFNDEKIMLNSGMQTNVTPLEPGKKDYFIFHETRVMFGDITDVKSYDITISSKN